MLNQRVPAAACAVKPKIPFTRYEYQDALPGMPLTGAELKTLLYLLKCGARTGEAWPKHATIARVCRIHQDTARRATHQLEDAGLIRIIRGRTHNRYRFPWHRGWEVRSEAAEMSDLPPYKGNPETEPVSAPMIGHNPALEIPLEPTTEESSEVRPKPTPIAGGPARVSYFSRFYEEYRERARLEMRAWLRRQAGNLRHPSDTRDNQPTGG